MHSDPTCGQSTLQRHVSELIIKFPAASYHVFFHSPLFLPSDAFKLFGYLSIRILLHGVTIDAFGFKPDNDSPSLGQPLLR